MALAKDAGIKGVRASVKVTVREDGKPSRSFDAVLYAARPGRVRLTGLELMGFTAFDMVLTGGKFYFYQPSGGTGVGPGARRYFFFMAVCLLLNRLG